MTVVGFDTWGSDNPRRPDYVVAKAGGASFAYFQRTQHVYTDSGVLRGDADAARAAGIVVGEYHMPGWGPRAGSAIAQVAAFKRAAAPPQRGIDLPPAIDLEGFKNCGWSSEQVAKFVCALANEFEAQLDVTPALYTSYFQIDDLKTAAKLLEPLARCPLWIKTAYRLQSHQPVDAVVPMTPHCGPDLLHDPHDYHRVPEPWATRSGHWLEQTQGDATGFPGHPGQVDVDRWHMIAPGYKGPEVLQLRAWCANDNAIAGNVAPDPLVYDDELAAVVEARQVAAGLVVDRVVGPRTVALFAWQ